MYNKYKIIDGQDYRKGLIDDSHGVILIKRELNGEEFAFGKFEDITGMEEVTDSTIIEELDKLYSEKSVSVISKRQAKQQLLLDGLLEQVQVVIDSLEGTEKQMAQIYWDDSTEFERDNSLLIQIGAALGLSNDDLDIMFAKANKL